MFNAPDYTTNLSRTLPLISKQITDLNGQEWRGYKLRVFFFGDYDFLVRIYGLYSPNGRYCCLFCTSTKDDINKGIKREPRCLQNMSEDYAKFIDSGSKEDKSKDVSRNIVRAPMVNVDIDHVSIPCLHISLGVFKKLYDLLECEAHEMDKQLYKFRQHNPSAESRNNFELCIAQSALKLEASKKQIAILEDEIVTIEDNMTIAQLGQSASAISSKTQKIKELKETIEKDQLKHGMGPIACSMDLVLKENRVDRRAYHGKAFNGNHVHKCCKVNCTFNI
ncbi:uncharacterized protein [Antedon mediterranea]|uniref:uncharacterized protein n=1 Tax=Antedon mediterranea TaxID=105859 RepID=UPI003AF70946